MGFWIFMLCMDLMIPVLMIIFGAVFLRCPPGEINRIYGYWTARSMASPEAWQYAHSHFGRNWFREGLALLLPCVAVMFPCMGKGDDVVGIWGGIVCTVECVLMILPVFWTERVLKRKFG